MSSLYDITHTTMKYTFYEIYQLTSIIQLSKYLNQGDKELLYILKRYYRKAKIVYKYVLEFIDCINVSILEKRIQMNFSSEMILQN